jgi:hypothetical protein
VMSTVLPDRLFVDTSALYDFSRIRLNPAASDR